MSKKTTPKVATPVPTQPKAAMNPEEFAAKMRDIFRPGSDAENAHRQADNLMLSVLKSLGYAKGANVFTTSAKKYA